MRILVIGGAGFIGRFMVRDLLAQGHDVAVYHRGGAGDAPPKQVLHILGDRNDLASHRREFDRFSPGVVLDMILSSERQAKNLARWEGTRGYVENVAAAVVLVLTSANAFRPDILCR